MYLLIVYYIFKAKLHVLVIKFYYRYPNLSIEPKNVTNISKNWTLKYSSL